MAALPTIDFKQIRAQDGSQNRAFEELCFQLLGDLVEIPSSANTVRHGTPDGGVEFLVELPDGRTWGWQAKYLFQMEGGALSQLDDSVRQALSSHPDLTRYTFCLPYNRPAGTVKGHKSARQKWKDRVQKWSRWARGRGMDVAFVYVGASELLQALTKERHAGRVRYWFGQDVFTAERFQGRLDEALAAVEPRYTRELHVDLPIAEVFDGLCRSPRYQKRLRRKLKQVRTHQQLRGEGLEVVSGDDRAAEIYEDLQTLVADVDRQVLALYFSTPGSVELPKLARSCLAARTRSTELWRHLERVEAKAQQERRERGKTTRFDRSSESVKSARWTILKLENALEELESLADSDSAHAVNTRAILVVGEAGSGKTHLLCDVARQRIEEGHPAILLLGQRFAGGDLWKQILEQADIDGRPDEFLGALEAAAQASGGPALLCIDALNEARDLRLWENHVAALLERVGRYPWISIALSCRTSYEEDLLPTDRFVDHVVRVEHRGFASKTQEAVWRFFRHYGLAQPNFPLTLPELGNPLFLKLMCISLTGTASPGLPRGLTAVTSVFQGFLQEVEKRLAKRCDYSPSHGFVRKAVERLAQHMVDSEAEWVSFERAEEVTQELLPRSSWSQSLLNGLVDEGVLIRDRPLSGLDRESGEVVRFAYQRLGDHACADRLCANGVDGVKSWFTTEPDELRSQLVYRSGWIRALAIQVPERFGVEFHELVCDRSSWRLQDAFLESLVWREPKAINPEVCLPFLREISCERDNAYGAPTLDVLLQVAVLPGHPFNANFLHRILINEKMPRRDAFWSIWVHSNRGKETPLGRLIGWAEGSDVTHLTEEGVELAAIVLTWTFSTSNRQVRDRATKALARLIGKNLGIATKLVARFEGVDDLYVLERLLAAVYGAVLTSREPTVVGSLARHVYSQFFEAGEPPVHLMVRDYASGIVEWAVEVCGKVRGVDLARVRPPFKSAWPIRAPKLRQEFEADDASYGAIRFMAMDWDFHRKVISPAVRDFLAPNQRRRQKQVMREKRLTAETRAMDFEAGLKPDQMTLLLAANELANSTAVAGLKASLEEDQEKQFRSTLRAYRLAEEPVGEVTFDVQLASRWIANRVVALGWRPHLFIEFDHLVRDWERNSPGAERVSEKYQWIAFYELLARLADHCDRKSWDGEAKRIEGSWEVEERDIDPTYHASTSESTAGWPSFRLLCDQIEKDEDWVRSLKDCAPVESLIDIQDLSEREWLVLEAYPEWEEETPPEVERWSVKHRRIWYQIRSYLIKRRDLKSLIHWARKQRLYGSRMPESHPWDRGLLGEYPWHPSTLGAQQGWTAESGGIADELPVQVLVTGCLYSGIGSRDYSVPGYVNGVLPNGPLLTGLGGRWAGAGLRFVNGSGRLVSWDPSGARDDKSSPSCLLVDPEALCAYLEEQDLTVFWTVVGEKIVHPGGLDADHQYVRGDISGALYLDGDRVCLDSLRIYEGGWEQGKTAVVVDSIGRG